MFKLESESVISTVVSKLKDFSRSRTVTYTVKVVIMSETVQDNDVATIDC